MIRVLLIDDEYLALNLLEEYASRLPGIVVIGKAKSAIQAMEILEKEPVDLLFLDIQMPVLSGINFLKALSKRPVTVFTSAYAEYAVEAYDRNVVDYLLKPFAFERFVQSIQKVKEALSATKTIETPAVEPAFIVVKVDGRLQKIALDDLLYVEGLKEYVRIITTRQQYVTFERMKNLEEMLPPADFLRVHKSYIVAKKAVQSIEGNLLDLGGKIKIPVSRDKRVEVVEGIFNQK